MNHYYKKTKSTNYDQFNLSINKPDLNFSNPINDEKIFIKPHLNGFLKTNIDQYLRSKGIKSVYVSGLITSVCVLNTIMGAINHGYDTYIVKDCCADQNKIVHDVALKSYYDYGIIKPVKIMNNLKRTKDMIPSKL